MQTSLFPIAASHEIETDVYILDNNHSTGRIHTLRWRAHSYVPGNRTGLVNATAFCPLHIGKFQPGYCSYAKFSSVTEMNKAQPFKIHPGNRAGVSISENFSLVEEIKR